MESNIKDIILIAALGLSVFNTYWTHFRKKKAFSVVAVSGFVGDFLPEFALINSGDTDVLVTSMECSIFHGQKGSSSVSPHIIDFKEYDYPMIKHGQAIYCKVKNYDLESFDPFKIGKKEIRDNREFASIDMALNISWIDLTSSIKHRNSVKLFKYSYFKSGKVSHRSPLLKNSYNLFRNKEETLNKSFHLAK